MCLQQLNQTESGRAGMSFSSSSHLHRILPKLAPVNLVRDDSTSCPHCKTPLIGGPWLSPEEEGSNYIIPEQRHPSIPENQKGVWKKGPLSRRKAAHGTRFLSLEQKPSPRSSPSTSGNKVYHPMRPSLGVSCTGNSGTYFRVSIIKFAPQVWEMFGYFPWVIQQQAVSVATSHDGDMPFAGNHKWGQHCCCAWILLTGFPLGLGPMRTGCWTRQGHWSLLAAGLLSRSYQFGTSNHEFIWEIFASFLWSTTCAVQFTSIPQSTSILAGLLSEGTQGETSPYLSMPAKDHTFSIRLLSLSSKQARLPLLPLLSQLVRTEAKKETEGEVIQKRPSQQHRCLSKISTEQGRRTSGERNWWFSCLSISMPQAEYNYVVIDNRITERKSGH